MRRAFVAAAALLGAVFALCHLAGLRQDLSVITLTAPAHESFERAVAGAVLYLASYFGATLLAPTLLLAALVHGPLCALARVVSRARARAGLLRHRFPVAGVGAGEPRNEPLRNQEGADGESQGDEVEQEDAAEAHAE